ncbi:MAG: hypothetical protein KGS44_07810 [Alphaproteobacteria bacterium]|jgi:hypothetical protein|nr:hypothetical protein [Alphaproteobacteria bacterium]
MTRGRMAEDASFKPIGLALAAVVAGLGPASSEGAAEERGVARDAPAPASADLAAEQDDSLLLGPSDPAEPFADQPASAAQPDLFDL